MSSSVFFKFKSQKEPSRVTFDGTGISVFELKREIITINKLGDGTDFDLAIYNQDTNEEYDEDTTIIPRSTYIIARRLPPAKQGRGSAQRYVSGKMPTVHNAGRIEKTKAGNVPPPKKEESSIPGISGSTEEDRIAAMFQASSEQWSKTQEQMAAATPIHRGAGPGGFKKPNAPVPSHPPPNGYICYRCGEKGHWIQACPTNTDPQFDNRTRIKRTTGIPRSFLKTVEKPVMASSEDDGEGHQNPSSVMVNADGEYVVAEPDKASWESYQQKAAKSTAQANESSAESKEIQEKGLECPIDHKLFKDAVKTPCCSKVYCEDCIQSALLESDFVCPACESKDIYLDNLVPDEEMRKKVEEYVTEKKQAKEKSKSPPASSTPKLAQAMTASKSNQGKATAPVAAMAINPKKRPAEDEIAPEKPRGPQKGSPTSTTSPKTLSPGNSPAIASVSPQIANSTPAAPTSSNNNNNAMPNGNFMPNGVDMSQLSMNDMMGMPMNPQMAAMMGNMMGMGNMGNMGNMANMNMNNMNQMGQMNNMMGMNGMNNMGMNNGMGAMNGMGMGDMNSMMGMNNNMGMMNPNQMNMNQQQQQQNRQNQYGNNNYNNQQQGGYGQMGGMNNMNNMNNMNMNHMNMNRNGNYGGNQQPQKFGMQGQMNMGNQQQQQQQQFNGYGHFPNQQRTVFSEPFPNEEDSPYMRKPVNPHRHNRPKRIRPSDFKALGE